ncbi:MAG: metallophosphoesterase [Clostridia bacterium]|nr:metallophosphoesterase [Clostridia bacterium]
MKVFAIGDLHLGFDNRIEKPMGVFGKDWEDHESRIKEDWLKQVKDDDIVLLVGDLSWGLRLEEAMADLDWISKLPGKKVLIKGNHDLWWQSYSKLSKAYPELNFLQNNSLDFGPVVVTGTRGWVTPGSEQYKAQDDEKIYKREVLRMEMALKDAAEKMDEGKVLIACTHYPPMNDKHQGTDFTRLLSEYGVKTCVYGHLHGKNVWPKGLNGTLNGVKYSLVSQDFLGGKLKLIYDTEEEK